MDLSDDSAHAVLAFVAAGYDYDWKEADKRLQMAMAATQVPPETNVAYANFFLIPVGRVQEAVTLMERTVALDPLHVPLRAIFAMCLISAEMYDRGIDEARKALEIDDKHFGSYFPLVLAYVMKGMMAEALAAAEKGYQIAPWHPRIIGLVGGSLGAYRRAGPGRGSDRAIEQGSGRARGAVRNGPLSSDLWGDRCGRRLVRESRRAARSGPGPVAPSAAYQASAGIAAMAQDCRDDEPARHDVAVELMGPPTPLLVETASKLKPGRALDLACGTGRNAVWLAEHGWKVTAVDRSRAIDDSLRSARHVADLEKHEFPIVEASWDLIAVSYYLQRDLFEPVKRGREAGRRGAGDRAYVRAGARSSRASACSRASWRNTSRAGRFCTTTKGSRVIRNTSGR